MSQPAIIRRHLALLRQVQPPFVYPSKITILERLQEEDLDAVSARTFERDIKEIESYYGIKIRHCRRNRGYFLDQPEDEDLTSFQQFVQLLERSERLAFLTHSSDALQTSKYLLLEENQSQDGLQHLPILWEALRTQRQVTFQYQTFQTTTPKVYQVDPLLLLEYRNRWYLATWDDVDKRFKTFGLERMQQPQLTKTPVLQDRRAEFLVLKQDALGVFVGAEQELTQVVLQVDKTMAPYFKTAPIHPSQTITEENDQGVTITLRITHNPELESLLLSYGEHLEVVGPLELREKLRQRVHALAERYN